MAEEGEKLTKEERELLWKEYELCQNSAQNLEAAIWQTGVALGIGSIGTLALVAGRQRLDDSCLLVFGTPLVIGLFAILASCIWWGMAGRWWSIQHAKFRRMRHIEERLELLYQIRYLDYLDDASDLSFNESDTAEEKQEKARQLRQLKERLLPSHLTPDQHKELEKRLKDHQRKGVKEFARCLLVLNGIAWGLYLALMLLALMLRCD